MYSMMQQRNTLNNSKYGFIKSDCFEDRNIFKLLQPCPRPKFNLCSFDLFSETLQENQRKDLKFRMSNVRARKAGVTYTLLELLGVDKDDQDEGMFTHK